MSLFFSHFSFMMMMKVLLLRGLFYLFPNRGASCFYEKFNTVVLVFVFSDRGCLSIFFIKRKWWY